MEATPGTHSDGDGRSVISYDRSFLLNLRFSRLSTAPPQRLLLLLKADGSGFPAEIVNLKRIQECGAEGGGSSSSNGAAAFGFSPGYVKPYTRHLNKSTKAVDSSSSLGSSAESCTQTSSRKGENGGSPEQLDERPSPYKHCDGNDLDRLLVLTELQREENAHALVTYLVLAALRRSAQEQELIERLIVELVRGCVVRPESCREGFLEAAFIVLNMPEDSPAVWSRFAVLLAATLPDDLRQHWCQQELLANESSDGQKSCMSVVDAERRLDEPRASAADHESNLSSGANSPGVHLTTADVTLSDCESMAESFRRHVDEQPQAISATVSDVISESHATVQPDNPRESCHQQLIHTELSCSGAGTAAQQSFREPGDGASSPFEDSPTIENFQSRAVPSQRRKVAERLMDQFQAKRFTALADDAGRTHGQRDVSKGSHGQLDRAAQRPPPSKLTAMTSQEERSLSQEAAKTIARGPTSRDSSQEEPRSTERRHDNEKSKRLSDEEIEKKASTIHEEYLHNVDVKEALQSIEELQQPDNIDVLVRCMIMSVLERSQQARKHTAQLLSETIKGGLISTESYLKGLCGVTEVADDLAVDVPLIWTYLSELIAPMLQADSLKMSSLLLICQPLVEVNRAGELLVKVLQESTRNLGAEKVTEMWSSSGLQWSSFFSSTNDVRSVLAQHKLEFLLNECESNVHAPVSRKNTTDTIASSLEEILIRSSGSNEDVFTWHEKNIQNESTKQRAFIRALVECVARKAIDQTGGTCSLRQDDLQKRAALLVRFIDKNSELELQALFALQSLLHRLQHPANILRSIFDWLYDEDIISEDTFYHWQKIDDPSEREGKGVALESTKQFFTWLQNAESADP